MNSVSIVLFGATGNLARKKLFPAFKKLIEKNSKKINIVAVGRREIGTDEFIQKFIEEEGEFFRGKLSYFKADLNNPDSLNMLHSFLEEIEEGKKSGRIYYLSTKPELFVPIIEMLAKNHMHKETYGFSRIIFEKPFGKDRAHAKECYSKASGFFEDKQIYIIDHYLGKEAIQNILLFRFANTMFEPMLSNKFISNIQIILDEKVGVGERADYYDGTGALKDMVQSHALQLAALIAMNAPKEFTAEEIKKEKVKAFESLINLNEKEIEKNLVLGRYTSGNNFQGYLEEKGVKRENNTETFAALKMEFSEGKFKGTPFFIRTGKMLAFKRSRIVLEFYEKQCSLFCKEKSNAPNRIILEIAPESNILIEFNIKNPYNKNEIVTTKMKFKPEWVFKERIESAYEKLLNAAVNGDKTLFVSYKEIDKAWEFIDNINTVCENKKKKLAEYPAKSHGPEEAKELIEKNGFKWVIK